MATGPGDSLPHDVQALKALLKQRDAQVAEWEAAIAQHKAQLAERDAVIAQHQAQLTEQQSTIEQMQRRNEGLSHRLSVALEKIYGRSSERLDPRQLLLFGRRMQQAAEAMEPTEAEGGSPSRRGRRRKGHGRRPLPADLLRHRVEHPIDPQQLPCPCCGERRVRIGEEFSEQMDFVPASLFVIEHVRPKFACRHCEDGGVVTAEKPLDEQVIDKGLPGPGLVAHVVTSKYADHLPLYRLERMLRRHGVEIARSTMCGWMKAAAELLAPLVKVMAERVRASKVIHTDDTPMPVQAKGRGRTRTGRIWVYLGDVDHPYTVFDYTPSRARDGPMQWLAAFRGYLQADAFGGYDGIYARSGGGEVIEVACWAHTRRKFYDARHSDVQRSHEALAMIRRLYDVEREAKDLSSKDRAALRRERSLPVLGEMQQWLAARRDEVLPKSPMGEATGYALNNWTALTRYARDGDLAIDNNVAERTLRPLTIGRKNYLFFGSDTGGRTGAILYSLIASAIRHGLDPFVYLRDVLAAIGSTPTRELDKFLPDRWRRSQLEEIANA